MRLILSVLVLCVVFTISMNAQDLPCLQFEELSPGTKFGQSNEKAPGDIVFEEAGVPVSLGEFLYSNEEKGFWDVEVFGSETGFGFPAEQGNSLFVSNINLTFDFSELDDEVTKICIDIWDGGGEENLAVNGGNLQVWDFARQSPDGSEIAPGVTATFTAFDAGANSFLPSGTLCLTGTLKSFTIGGQEFLIDNLCLFSEKDDTDDDEGCYTFDDFEEKTYGEETGFGPGDILFEDDALRIGLIELQDFDWFRRFGNLKINPLTEDLVFPQGNGNILTFEEIGAVFNLQNYPGTVEQISFDFSLRQGPANIAVNGGQVIILDDLETSFTALAPGITLEIKNDAELANAGSVIIRGPVKTLLLGGIVLHIDNLCINVEEQECVNDELEMSEVSCSDTGKYSLKINFKHRGSGTQFLVETQSGFSKTFEYSDLPVQLEAIPIPDNGKDLLEICDVDNPNCCIATEYEIDCGPICEIWDVVAKPLPCNDNGTYDAVVDFNYARTSDQFDLFINDELFGRYAYEDLPVTIGSFDASLDIALKVKIIDSSEQCYNYTELLSPNCDPEQCQFQSVKVTAGECDGDGYFKAELSFEVANPNFLGYYVYVNGVINGPYEYEASINTQVFGPLKGDDSSDHEFLILDIAEPSCFGYYELPPIDCDADDEDLCKITELQVRPGECLGDGYYHLILDFEYEDPTHTHFDVLDADGEIIGYYKLEDLPVKIEAFKGSGDGRDALAVCINDNPNCCAKTQWEAPDCNNDCLAPIIKVIEPHRCDGEEFYVDIEVAAPSDDARGYTISTANGRELGTFDYTESFVTVGPFEGDGESKYLLVFTDLDNPDCSSKEDFKAIDCRQVSCEIKELEVKVGDCNEDGTYSLKIDFIVRDPNVDKFDLYVRNGVLIGTYSIADLPLELDAFEPSDFEEDYLKICYAGAFDCCREIEFKSPVCNGGVCQIRDLEVVVGECNDDDDDTYRLKVDFKIDGNPNDFFDLYVRNEELIGTFKIEDLPIVVENFETSGREYDFIQVCINDIDNCCKAIEFKPADCDDDDCEIDDLEVNIGECNFDGSYQLKLDFNVENAPNEVFDVYRLGNELIGSFNIADLPIVIENFQPSDREEDFIKVCINDHPDCCEVIEFESPGCDTNDCQIKIAVVEAHPCVEGKFLVDVELASKNTSGQGYSVFDAEGVLLGSFQYDDPFITLGPFTGDGVSPHRLLFVDNVDENCRTEASIGPVICGDNGCQISDILVEPHECDDDDDEEDSDNNYSLDLDFSYNAPESELFEVFKPDGSSLGQFSLQDLPITLEDFPTSGAASDSLTLCIDNQQNCCVLVSWKARECTDEDDDDDEFVWPGDANDDNIVQHYDLLNIGLAFNKEGPTRERMGIEWTGVPSEDWENEFSNGINFKHADCNGDGIIDRADRTAIVENYGRDHGTPKELDELDNTLLAPPVFVDFSEIERLPPNTAFKIPIVLGTENEPVEDIYGVAFSVAFDRAVINPESIEIEYPVSWFGDPSVNVITIDQVQAEQTEIEIAITRIDQNNVSGYGTIAFIKGIIDDIAGIRNSEIEIEKIKALSKHGDLVPLSGPRQQFNIMPEEEGVGKHDLLRQLKVFPNPTTGDLTISNSFAMAINGITLVQPDGRIVSRPAVIGNSLKLGPIPDGVYILRIEIGEYVIHKRVIKTQ